MEKHAVFGVSAYVVAGGAEKIDAIRSFLNRAGIETGASPDVYIRDYVSFGIDDARELRERSNTRAIESERRVFIIVSPSMTTDAQNALLKTLEEPPADAVFFFVVASPSMLLPTLRSRAHVLHLEGTAGTGAIEVQEFLSARPEKRIDMLKLLYEKPDGDERDIRKAVQFLHDIEVALSKRKRQEAQQGIHAVYRARKYLMDKGSLMKPLLEQVALLTPQL